MEHSTGCGICLSHSIDFSKGKMMVELGLHWEHWVPQAATSRMRASCMNCIYIYMWPACCKCRLLYLRKVEVKRQTVVEIGLCQANEFSSVKSEVLWSEIKINSAQSTHCVPWSSYCWRVFERHWATLYMVNWVNWVKGSCSHDVFRKGAKDSLHSVLTTVKF